MALVVKDRVKEVTTTVGTSDFTLGGAVLGYQSFSVIGNTNQTYYSCSDPATGDWEVGIGTYSTTGPTLTRDTVLESSNSGSKVSFAAGSKDIFCTYPAERSVYLDAAGSAVTVLDVGTLGTSTANITTANITSGTVSTTPTSSTDIANKTYVDNLVASGTSYHTPVKYEVPNTTGNLTALYNNGTGGVGATLTNNGTLVAFAPDGPTASPGDRILVYNQTNAYENGVYEVTTVGSGSVAWVLTRTADADSYGVKDPDALGNGDAFFVTSGNTGAGETYICNTVGTITFGTTAITFAQISSAQVYTAGTGISFSPSTTINIANTGVAATTYGSASQVPVFAVNAQGQLTSVTNTSIAIAAGAVSGLAASATTDTTNASNISSGTLPTGRLTGSYTGITGVGTLTAGTWNANTIGVTYGGTGFSSYTVGDLLYADTSSTLAKLADVAYGSVLLSGGVGTAPSYGKVSLTAHVTGTLAVVNGGTGATTLTGYVYGNGTGAMTASTSIPNSATTATSANTASAIVARDASGNFSAGTITATLNGNASTATTASNVNNGTLTMNVSGTGLSGSQTFTANQSSNVTFTVTSNATSANTASTIVARDASGNFSAGTITATLSGNATSATSATTATSATSAGYSTYLITQDIRTLSPSSTAAYRLGFGFTSWANNNTSPYADYLALRSYSDASGGNDNLLMFNKSTIGMRLWQQSFGSATAYSSYADVLMTNNYNSYAPTLTGTGASGTWSINITGSAGSATTATTASNANLLNNISAVNLYNNMGDPHGTRSAFDASTPSYGFGYRYVQGSTNGPGTGGTQYYSWYIGLGSDYPATGAGSYGAMFAVDRNVATPYLSVRYNEANSFGSWRKVAAGYADSAGSATNITAYTINQSVGTGNSPTFADLYVNNWFRNNSSNTGLYNQSTTQHLSSNTNGYWDMSSTTSVSAIRFYTGGHVTSLRGYVYANSSNEIGFLNTAGSWSWRMDNSGNGTATGSVTAYSDERLKKDWEPVAEDFVERLAEVKSGTYTRTDIGERQAGSSAQDWQKLLPEVVRANDEGILSLAYGNAALVACVELAKEVMTLRAEIKELSAKVDRTR